MCNVYPIFRDLRQFLLIVALILEVLPSNLQLYTYPRLYLGTCRFYKAYLADSYSFVSGLDWTGLSFWVISWTGLDQDPRIVDLDWTGSYQLNPFHTLTDTDTDTVY